MIFYVGAMVLIAQQVADAAITQRMISTDAGKESRPLAAWTIAKFGVAGLWFQKAGILPVIAGIIYVGPPWQHVIWLLIIFYSVMLYSNWRVLMGRKALL